MPYLDTSLLGSYYCPEILSVECKLLTRDRKP
jgi:hypothetical protein